MVIGDIITLKGISKRGKDRIAQHGSEWEIIPKNMMVRADGTSFFFTTCAICDNIDEVNVRSIKTNDVRRINVKNDKNFEIVL